MITAVAVIGLFAVTGSFAPPANADCPHNNNPDHRHCTGGGGGGGGDSSEVIGVHGDVGGTDPDAPLWAPTDVLATCVLQKNSGKSLSGAFPRHAECATLMTTGDAIGDDIIIVVDTDNRGEVLSVQVQGQDTIGADGIVYITDLMTPVRVDNNSDGNMVIHVHADNVNIYRCDTHVLKQKSICNTPSGIFAIDDLVYSSGP
jgi:hypothetical protein